MTIQNHRYLDAEFIASPHVDERPDPDDISLLVVHGISLPAGDFGGPHITNLFLGCLAIEADPSFNILKGLRVSAHCLIRRDGQVIQYVAFNERAWHAGVSAYAGRKRCNDYAIGVELEGTDDTPYTEKQYAALAQLTTELLATYPKLTRHRLVGHEHIAPGRKTDPGPAFDWQQYRRLVDRSTN